MEWIHSRWVDILIINIPIIPIKQSIAILMIMKPVITAVTIMILVRKLRIPSLSRCI